MGSKSDRALVCKLLSFIIFSSVVQVWAQNSIANDKQSAISTIPRLIKYSGMLSREAGGVSTMQSLTFAVYEAAEGGAPLWLETQNVRTDESGRYTVLLGSNSADGLPSLIFLTGEARWLGVRVNGTDSEEQVRTSLVSVPYAIKAGDAETLGGKPISAFMLSTSQPLVAAEKSSVNRLNDPSRATPETSAQVGTTGGTTNYIAKFLDSVNVANSSIFDTGTAVGIGTVTPASILHLDRVGSGNYLRFSNNGTFRGLIGISGGGGDLTSGDVANDLVIRSQQNIIFANGNVEAMRFTNGNVGIGTTGPASIFHLDRVGSGNYIRFSGAGALRGLIGISGGGGDLASGDVANDMVIRSQQNIIFANGSVEAMRFSAGNVGLGITSPVSILHLDRVGAGNYVRFSSSGALRGLIGISGGGGDLTSGDVANDMVIRAQQNLIFANGSLEAMRFANGTVGIGTQNPLFKLDVADSASQVIRSVQSSGGAVTFSIGAPPPSAIHGDTTATSGFVSGIFGTTSSSDGFGVLGENLASCTNCPGHSAGVRGITANTSNLGTGVWGDALQTTGDNVGVFGHSSSNAGTGVEGFADAGTGDAVGVYGRSDSISGTGVFGEATAGSSGTIFPVGVYGKAFVGAAGLFDSTGAANIILGRTGSGATNVFRVDNTGKMFANGGTATSGADFAESVGVLNERSAYEPGDVMAIDTTGIRRFAKVTKPYSTLVAGIYSTKPGVLATPHAADDPRHETEEIPLAMVGIVPCKVSNENGSINAGDLLVSSSIPGFAMKGTDRSRMTGAVVGKALQPMLGSTGIIQVLVSLQ